MIRTAFTAAMLFQLLAMDSISAAEMAVQALRFERLQLGREETEGIGTHGFFSRRSRTGVNRRP